jgi:ADP-ribose pyrophosphatase YjhB (NUDIX family)
MSRKPQAQASVDAETLARDLIAEGEPEKEFNPGIASRFPRKNVAAGALIRDNRDRILFVVPTYKPFLDIPGGVAEDNESPRAACERELTEELGLSLKIGPLLIIDWIPTHGVWSDSLQMIYDGGTLSRDQIERIELDTEELGALQFLAINDALPQLRPSMARRMTAALAALQEGQTLYTEFGHRL